ncbi:unnamed protein product [Caenorhabditis angaria]|uniref:Receptor ligand binding region domain-containing protein n=1 Tax=Caenorhabditis angaria TaxID=860376 RepID=A0A9P1MZS8_9PELO|nr:unnamed protein product [Caenorhabditis angaria]
MRNLKFYFFIFKFHFILCIAKKRGLISSGPCTFPLPPSTEFRAFCQIDYHNVSYVCDPGGILSRTEIEILHETVKKLNMTSCFCSLANNRICDAGIKIAILLLPTVNWQSIQECDPLIPPSSTISHSTIIYAQLLSDRWKSHCDYDVIFVYFQNLQTGLRTPLLIPIFGDHWPHLRRFSIPIITSTRESTLVSLQNAMSQANRLIQIDSSPAHAAIPRWALALGGIMLSVVVAAIYIANCITERMGQRNQKSVIPKRANDKYRAGFGGGVMMNNGSQKKKSVMMFRTFSKSAKQTTNNNRL